MTTRFAFVGFRHPHIRDMYNRCQQRDDVEIVACCEEDEATRASLAVSGDVNVTHDRFEAMLEQVDCDVVAVGDVYAKRGRQVERALEAGKHVVSDKPLCVTLDELDRIEERADANQRVVGCMLDMRDLPMFLSLRDLIRGGEIGTVQAISFDGQHPLLSGTRANWYFEEGMHGGVINDIAIHAIDLIPWATGLQIQSVVAARCWNATVPQAPHFKQCGQGMLTLENEGGVIFDVSYLTPDSFAYKFPHYWRFTFWGEGGVISAAYNAPAVTVYKNGETEPREAASAEGKPGGYLESFLQEISGQTEGLHLSSAEVRQSSRVNLMIQHAADNRLSHVELPMG